MLSVADRFRCSYLPVGGRFADSGRSRVCDIAGAGIVI